MNINEINESVKTQLEIEIGCFVLDELYEESEYDLLDAYSIANIFLPANYIKSRENYIYG